MTAWTQRQLTWIRQVWFEQPAQEATRLDYLHEVEHVVGRIERLERAIDEAVMTAPPRMRAVIEALQALRGIARVSAVTIVAEVGDLSRFQRAPQLMGYSGMGAREDSSGPRTRQDGITKTGNAHLRRIAIEAAWRIVIGPAVGGAVPTRNSVPIVAVEVTLHEPAVPFAASFRSPPKSEAARPLHDRDSPAVHTP